MKKQQIELDMEQWTCSKLWKEYVKAVYCHPGYLTFMYVQFSSVTQSYLTHCDPMNHSMPGLPVHHQLPEFTQTHVHQVEGCHPAISSSVVPFFSCPQSLPESGSFPVSQLFASCGQSIGISASALVLPMNTQDWSPLGWTGWISLQSNGLSRVFSNTTVQKHPFWVIFHGAYVPELSYPFICWWASRLLPCPGYYKQCCNEHWGCTCLFQTWFPQCVCPEVGLLGHMAVLFLVF